MGCSSVPQGAGQIKKTASSGVRPGPRFEQGAPERERAAVGLASQHLAGPRAGHVGPVPHDPGPVEKDFLDPPRFAGRP